MRRRAPIPGESHHWWPKSLSKGWCDASGRIQSIRHDGWRKAYVPKAIGRIIDGHNILPGGPWNATFEPLFDRADNDFPAVVAWLKGLHRKALSKPHRAHAPEFPELMRTRLAHCAASLIARNPTMREKARRGIASYRLQPGVPQPGAADMTELVTRNIEHLYLEFARIIATSGKFAFLYAPQDREFIFGDGFLHNFEPMRHLAFHGLCLIPFVPEVTVLWFLPASSWVFPKAVTMPLREDELAFCNEAIQVYSRDFIYYRFDEPVISDALGTASHLVYDTDGRPHAHPVLDALIAEVLDCRLPSWGRQSAAAGTAS